MVDGTVNPYCIQVHRSHLCPGGQRPAEQGQRLHQPLGGGRGGGGEAVQARGGEQSQVRTRFLKYLYYDSYKIILNYSSIFPTINEIIGI